MFVNDPIVQLVAAVEQVWPPGLAVTVYPVTEDPPEEPAVHDTVALVSPALPVTEVGADGVVAATTTSGSVNSSTVTVPSVVARPSSVTCVPTTWYTIAPAWMLLLLRVTVMGRSGSVSGTVALVPEPSSQDTNRAKK